MCPRRTISQLCRCENSFILFSGSLITFFFTFISLVDLELILYYLMGSGLVVFFSYWNQLTLWFKNISFLLLSPTEHDVMFHLFDFFLIKELLWCCEPLVIVWSFILRKLKFREVIKHNELFFCTQIPFIKSLKEVDVIWLTSWLIFISKSTTCGGSVPTKDEWSLRSCTSGKWFLQLPHLCSHCIPGG